MSAKGQLGKQTIFRLPGKFSARIPGNKDKITTSYGGGGTPPLRGGVKIYFARCRGVYFPASAKKTRRVRLLFYKKHRLRAEKSWNTHTGYSERIVLRQSHMYISALSMKMTTVWTTQTAILQQTAIPPMETGFCAIPLHPRTGKKPRRSER